MLFAIATISCKHKQVDRTVAKKPEAIRETPVKNNDSMMGVRICGKLQVEKLWADCVFRFNDSNYLYVKGGSGVTIQGRAPYPNKSAHFCLTSGKAWFVKGKARALIDKGKVYEFLHNEIAYIDYPPKEFLNENEERCFRQIKLEDLTSVLFRWTERTILCRSDAVDWLVNYKGRPNDNTAKILHNLNSFDPRLMAYELGDTIVITRAVSFKE
jgi:hypothetical protein